MTRTRFGSRSRPSVFAAARALIVAGALGTGATAGAHDVHGVAAEVPAVVVTLTYGDGTPFADEAFEARRDGEAGPRRTGRTDSQGRAVLLAPEPGRWRLTAFSDDGHGLSLGFEVGGVGATPSEATPSRWPRALSGLGVLVAVFVGLYFAVARRRRSPHRGA